MERVLFNTTNVPMPNENGWGRHMESQQVFCPTRMLPFSNLLSENHLLYNGKSGIRFFCWWKPSCDTLCWLKCRAASNTKHSYNATPVKTCHQACSCGIPKIGILILRRCLHATRSNNQQIPPIAVKIIALFALKGKLYLLFLGSILLSSRSEVR